MLYFPPWKVFTVLAVLLIGTVLALPSMLPRAALDALPDWLPKQTVNLGLDLQGGVHLLLEVGMDELVDRRLESVLDETWSKLRTAKIGYKDLVKSGSAVNVTLVDPTAMDAAKKELASAIADGMEITEDGPKISMQFTEPGLKALKARTVEQSIEVLRKRIDEGGTTEPTIIREGEDRIVLQVPGVIDAEVLKKKFNTQAVLTFRMVDEAAAAGGALSPTSQVFPGAEGEEFAAFVQACAAERRKPD